MPNGKEVTVETRDGFSKVIKNDKFFRPKVIQFRWETRLELGYGANNRLIGRGRPLVEDRDVWDAVINNRFVDCNNVAYDFDVTSEFTWGYKELVEIKKSKRQVDRYYRPTPKVMMAQISADNWKKQQKLGTIISNRKIVKGYKLYKYYSDLFWKSTHEQLPGEYGALKEGDLMYKKPVTEADIVVQRYKYKNYLNNGGQEVRNKDRSLIYRRSDLYEKMYPKPQVDQ